MALNNTDSLINQLKDWLRPFFFFLPFNSLYVKNIKLEYMEKDSLNSEKQLLLVDLCGRLPYRVKCKYYDCCEGDYDEGTICGFERQEYIQIDGVCIHIEDIKPYLFPLSNMTLDQRIEYSRTLVIFDESHCSQTSETYDWLNKNHFDYRGLIEKGLALDATGLNIY